jgi:NAD+ kinase
LLSRQGELQRVHHVLNECLIDRGASPSMVTLEVSVDGHHVTTAQVRRTSNSSRDILTS